MNIITNTLFLFIFIYISLIIGVPGLEQSNLIKNKLYIFGGIFIFQLLLKSIYKLKNRCKNISIKEIIKESFIVSILSVVGYSVYIDLLTMDTTKEHILYYLTNPTSKCAVISGIISLFILASLIINIIITGKIDECEISEVSN